MRSETNVASWLHRLGRSEPTRQRVLEFQRGPRHRCVDARPWQSSSPGAHVVLQYRRGSAVAPTEACFAFCANLAIFYSDARGERKSEVTAAEPKHVLKPRGAPLGAVKLREELRILSGFPDQVPEEIKSARDESGLPDEFRAEDKAKQRKRIKAVATQNQSKRTNRATS